MPRFMFTISGQMEIEADSEAEARAHFTPGQAFTHYDDYHKVFVVAVPLSVFDVQDEKGNSLQGVA